MTVSTIASIAAGITRTSGNPSTQAASLFKSLLTQSGQSSQLSGDSTNLTAALTLQNQVAQFRVASQNVAQASSILTAADAGVTDILSDLDQLNDIAQKASTTTDSGERNALKIQAEAIINKIDQTANSTKFNNEALLNGSSPQLRVASDNQAIKDLQIGSLLSPSLFKGGLPDIATSTGAKAALDQIKEAKAYATKQRDTIKSLEKGLDLASSTLQTAIQNNEAARSNFDDGDLISQLLGGGGSTNPASLLAQTNNLPGNILSLLKE